MALVDLDQVIIHIAVNTIIIGPVLWLAGRALVGKKKAKFTDGLWIAALGTIIGSLLGFLFSGIIASIIVVIIWLALIKRFFDCGWLRALLIAIVAIIIFIIITAMLALIGFVGLRPFLARLF